MSKEAELLRKLREFKDSITMPAYVGTVVSVAERTCEVKIGTMIIVAGLQVTDDGCDSLLISYPKVGSEVMLLATSSEISDLFVVKCQEVDKIVYITNKLSLAIDGVVGKLSVVGNGVSLFQLFTDLKTLLAGFKVSTPAGPSVRILPDTEALLMQWEVNFKRLLQ